MLTFTVRYDRDIHKSLRIGDALGDGSGGYYFIYSLFVLEEYSKIVGHVLLMHRWSYPWNNCFMSVKVSLFLILYGWIWNLFNYGWEWFQNFDWKAIDQDVAMTRGSSISKVPTAYHSDCTLKGRLVVWPGARLVVKTSWRWNWLVNRNRLRVLCT